MVILGATFDTHAAVKALTKAGVDPAQAEAITETMRDAVTEGIATKAGIADLKAELTWRLAVAAGIVIVAIKLIP